MTDWKKRGEETGNWYRGDATMTAYADEWKVRHTPPPSPLIELPKPPLRMTPSPQSSSDDGGASMMLPLALSFIALATI